jgi:NAD-dependent DNA ligase
MKFVFTGPATVRGERVVRDDLVRMATTSGHQVATAVNATVDYVVASEPTFMSRKGSKLRKADALGIPCISPDVFVQFLKAEEARR